MKLDPIERLHILAATEIIDQEGKSNGADYFVHVDERNDDYPFKQLIRIAYRLATDIPITNDFFQSNSFYRGFVERKFSYTVFHAETQGVTFFSKDDIQFFAEHAGNTYQQGNEAARQTGLRLRETIFEKTRLWAQLLQIDGFDYEIKLHWQRRGTFEKYAWARIFRLGEEDRGVFFTVEVDAVEQALIYKLDCYFRSAVPGKALSNEQIDTFNRIIEHSPAKWNGIELEDVEDYDWNSLVETTRQFIKEFAPLYDEVVAALWDLPPVENNTFIPLRQYPIPTGVVSPTQKIAGQFQGNADYEGDTKWKKQIGDCGEELVMNMLKNNLINAGKSELAGKICKVPDWNGYDILAYDNEGKEQYIEVKTTCGSVLRPFFWTINELHTMKNNVGNYFLYRLYNYDPENNTADFFILDGSFSDRIITQPTVFEVYIKKQD